MTQKAPCCISPAQFEYLPLHKGVQKELVIDASSSTYDFGDGISYFYAFSLPSQKGYYFQIDSFFNGLYIGQFFNPLFIVLNEKS